MDELHKARLEHFLAQLTELKDAWRLSEDQFRLLLGSQTHHAWEMQMHGGAVPELDAFSVERVVDLCNVLRLSVARFPNDRGASWIQIFGNPGQECQTPLLQMTTRRDGVQVTLSTLKKLSPTA